MNSEREIHKFLEEQCYTTPEDKDPRKPFILNGKFVQLNPDYNSALVEEEARNREIERREKHLGTSFFLNFDPLCNIHQIEGSLGDSIRRKILEVLFKRLIQVFIAQFPDNPPPSGLLENALQVGIFPDPQPGANNGEVFLWLKNFLLKEEFIFKVLMELKRSIEDKPIVVELRGEKYQVAFYGWGFRYI